MLPEQVYETYVAVKAHFAGKYDFHKYGGKIRAGRMNGAEWPCNKIARSGRDPVLLFAANLVRGKNWIGDIASDGGDAYASVESYCQSGVYALGEDLQRLTHSRFDDNLRLEGDDYSVLRQVRDWEIRLETAVLLDELTGFLDQTVSSKNPVLAQEAAALRRYAPFLPVPRDGRVAEAVLKIFPGGSRV